MRCSQCGLPLSPSRTSCPRCSTAVGGSEKETEIKYDALLLPEDIISSTKYEEGNSQQQVRGEQSGSSILVQQYATIDPPPLQTYTQQAKKQVEQRNLRLSPPTPAPVSTWSEPAERTKTDNAASRSKGARATKEAGVLTSLLPNSVLEPRRGFTIAGVCMGIGALILIFVFIMAQSLSAMDNAAIQAANQRNRERATAMAIPTLSPAPSPTISNATPLADTPGSKYIDNIQIGTTINMSSVVITQVTKNFKAGQRIYITMNVNSTGYQGAVCLDWYVQDVYVTHFAFPTTADPSLPHSTAWSYAALTSKGTGHVDVSWATSTICADKVLAQRVDFSVGT